MSITYVSNTGAQATSGTQATVSATIPGTLAAGSLVVVDVVWGNNSGNTGPPTHVQDSANSGVNYSLAGPGWTANQACGTYWSVVTNGGSSVVVTVTCGSAPYVSMAVTVYTFTGNLVQDNYQSVVNNTGSTNPSAGSYSTNSSYGTILLHCGFAVAGNASTSSAGSGFTLRYSAAGTSAPTVGIAAIDQIGATGSVTPQITISSSQEWTANAVQFRAYATLGNATSYTVSTTAGGHQNVQATWTVSLVGGDWSGTVTGTPGGGISQCEIYTPVAVTFPHNGITSFSFQFTPLIVDSVTFTFTNTGSFTNPGPYTYVSTGEYLLDTFSGTSGTAISSHTSNTLPSGLTGSQWGTASGGALQLDGGSWSNASLGGVFLESTGDSVSYWPGTLPGGTLPTAGLEWQFDFERLTAVSGAGTGLVFLDDGTHGPYELNWTEGVGFQINMNGTHQANYGTVAGPAAGTLWRIKIDATYQTNPAYLNVNTYYSTNNGSTWTTLLTNGQPQYSTISQNVSAGIYGHGTAVTTTTGPHIGNVVVQDITPPPANCQIATSVTTPTGGTVYGAYITTSGTMAAFFFQTISGGSAVSPTVQNYSPSFFRNGSSIGQGQNAWLDSGGRFPCVLFQLPAGITILPTDTVTVSTPASWMTCGTGNAANGVTGATVANYTGKSSFGTDSIAKTFKPGLNFSNGGTADGTFYNLPMNWRYRLAATNDGTTYTPDGYPTGMAATTWTSSFCNIGASNVLDSTGIPSALAGYWAIGFDDNYVAHSGTASTLAIVSGGSGSTVTPVSGNNNPGSGGLNQFYMFNVQPDGSGLANMPLSLQITNSAKTPYISNLWIVGPGDFTVPGGGVTTWSFNRYPISAPYKPSNQLVKQIPYGCGSMRWCDSTQSVNSDMTSEAWEIHGLQGNGGDGTDFSFNNWNFGGAGIESNTINFNTFQPLAINSTSWAYFPGLTADGGWPSAASAYNLTLATGVNSSATTFSLTATVDAYAIPISGLLLYMASGGEKCRIRTVSGSYPNYTVTVERGSSNTTATAQSSGTITCASRMLMTSLSQVGTGVIQVITAANHGLKTGMVVQFPNGTYPSPLTFTDLTTLTNIYNTVCVVTGPTSFALNMRTGDTVTLNQSYSLTGCYWTYNLPDVGFGPDFVAYFTGQFSGVKIHVNIPLCATDSYCYEYATIVKNNFPAGRTVYVELSDEFWNIFQTAGFQGGIISSMRGDANLQTWQVLRTGQIRTIFRTVFGSRANEIVMVTGSFILGPTLTQTLLNSHIAQSIPCDCIVVAPYVQPSDATATINMNNINTIEQNVDLWAHDVLYDTQGVIPFFAQHQAQIAAYNTSTSGSCFLHGYEGGYQWGVGSNNGGTPVANNLTQLSRDVAYDPNFRIVEKDFYGALQAGGFKNLNLYSFCIYYNFATNWGLYHWPFQLPGHGTGVGGFNNRLVRATAGLSGPVDYTKASTVNQDANSDSIRGQALLEWMSQALSANAASSSPAIMLGGL
jgi:hypothetical protein